MPVTSKKFTIKEKKLLKSGEARIREKEVVKYRFNTTYTDPSGQRKRYASKWFLDKLECEQAYVTFKTNAGMFVPGKKTFGEIAREYVEKKRPDIAESTYREDKRYIEKWFTPVLAKQIDRITALDITAMLDPYSHEYSTKYVNKAYDLLNQTFEYAITYYGLTVNPMNRTHRYLPKEKEKLQEMKTWTIEQFDRFIAEIPESKWHYAVLYRLLFYSGLRKNEALSLTWNDFDGQYVNVYRQFRDGSWHPLKTKNSRRKVLLDTETIRQLDRLHSWAKEQKEYSDDWFMFGDYSQMPTTEIDRVKSAAIEKAGLPYIRIHDFRHSHASHLIRNGVNMVTVSRRLGHSSIQMTIDRYTHIMPEDQSEIAELFG